VRKAVLAATSLLFVCGTIGSNIGPALVDEHPLLVLTLSSRNRNLFGSVPFTSPVPYFVIGFLRILAAGIALYFVGELPALYRWTERAVARAGWLAVALMPGSNVVCVLVGHRRMKFSAFLSCITLGIVGKLIVLRIGGDIFEDQVRSFLKTIERYQWWVVVALFAVSFLQTRKRRPLEPPVNDEVADNNDD